jgi:hypothetical protein
MPEDCRAPCADIIDVFLPIDVPNARAFRTIDEERFAANGSKGAHRRVDAAGNHSLRERKQIMRARIHDEEDSMRHVLSQCESARRPYDDGSTLARRTAKWTTLGAMRSVALDVRAARPKLW